MAFDFELESLKMALNSIRERKMRSALTALGIIIGIAAIIALVSIGTGTQAAVSSALSSLGANTLFISGGGGGGGGFSAPSTGSILSKKDLTTIQSIAGVKTAVGIFVKSQAVTFKSETKRLSFFGIDAKDAQKFFNEVAVVQIEQGRYFRTGENRAVVLGHTAAASSFTTALKVGDKLTVGEQKFQVVGILKETGSSNYDNTVLVSADDIRDPVTEKDQFTIIFARASDAKTLNATVDAIQKKMDNLHGKKNFQVFTTAQLSAQIGTVTNTLSIVLGGIAGIALLVAGIGIANTMLMSVIERTKEIGIMKSIGATSRNILEIFLVEAAIIGFVGGIIGDLFGIIFSSIIGLVLRNYGVSFTTEVTPQLLLFGLGFSVLVGVFFGLLPARRASKLNPIEALRYE